MRKKTGSVCADIHVDSEVAEHGAGDGGRGRGHADAGDRAEPASVAIGCSPALRPLTAALRLQGRRGLAHGGGRGWGGCAAEADLPGAEGGAHARQGPRGARRAVRARGRGGRVAEGHEAAAPPGGQAVRASTRFINGIFSRSTTSQPDAGERTTGQRWRLHLPVSFVAENPLASLLESD